MSDIIDFLEVFDEEVLLVLMACDFSDPAPRDTVADVEIDVCVGLHGEDTELAVLITSRPASFG